MDQNTNKNHATLLQSQDDPAFSLTLSWNEYNVIQIDGYSNINDNGYFDVKVRKLDTIEPSQPIRNPTLEYVYEFLKDRINYEIYRMRKYAQGDNDIVVYSKEPIQDYLGRNYIYMAYQVKYRNGIFYIKPGRYNAKEIKSSFGNSVRTRNTIEKVLEYFSE